MTRKPLITENALYIEIPYTHKEIQYKKSEIHFTRKCLITRIPLHREIRSTYREINTGKSIAGGIPYTRACNI
jgi:hypothetical protein